jgi:hypothetical protein
MLFKSIGVIILFLTISVQTQNEMLYFFQGLAYESQLIGEFNVNGCAVLINNLGKQFVNDVVNQLNNGTMLVFYLVKE